MSHKNIISVHAASFSFRERWFERVIWWGFVLYIVDVDGILFSLLIVSKWIHLTAVFISKKTLSQLPDNPQSSLSALFFRDYFSCESCQRWSVWIGQDNRYIIFGKTSHRFKKNIYIRNAGERKKNFSSLCQKFQIDISTLPQIKLKYCHDWIRAAGGGNRSFVLVTSTL